MNKFFKFILDLIFPIYCVGCKKEGEWACKDCFNKTKLLCQYENDMEINVIKKKNIDNLTYIDDIFYFFDFDNKIISELIHILKYKYAYDIARFLAKITYKDFFEFIFYLEQQFGKFIFIPIPLNKKRLNERGFNQSEIILIKLLKIKNKKQKTKTESLGIIDLVKRVRNTAHQASLSGKDRDNNLKNAFVLNNKIDFLEYKNFNIILFDDVVTTGNTFDTCAKVLRENGFTNMIIGIAIAGQN